MEPDRDAGIGSQRIAIAVTKIASGIASASGMRPNGLVWNDGHNPRFRSRPRISSGGARAEGIGNVTASLPSTRMTSESSVRLRPRFDEEPHERLVLYRAHVGLHHALRKGRNIMP